ncbi:hypothetical protein CspeluHIS016_0110910 [Cutaneotrichosporon spelunceum]|uniref:Uncharacterized protein n=1 Tax=Cutaneotrichosporon spelunceum TaxID=1672016 RepID=A0AAD3TQF9_9TREE|nr:hypothetical protein CspeluHIS016_0110910 [Cutaneotrichosporon spelunceum]
MSSNLTIHRAAQEGQPGLIRSLLADNEKLINAKDEDGRTPLHWAATAKNLGVTQLLLSNAADVEARDSLGWTPLVIAAAAGQMENVTAFLDAGAKVDAANDKGQTALHYAASKGNVPMGRLLITRGADINARDRANQHPLHRAATTGNGAFMNILLHPPEGRPKTRLNTADRAGNTPLHLAMESGHGEAAVILLEAGADRERPNSEGQVPEEIDGVGSEEQRRVRQYVVSRLYVTLRTDVVGIQYYAGLVGNDEYVMLRRQPANPYDSNAVQVLNASGIQVGHIPRGVAARIAQLMDTKIISVEGRMVGQNLDGARRFKLPMDMSIYGRASHREVLEHELSWATPMERGFDYMRQQEAAAAAKLKGKGRAGETGLGGSSGGVGDRMRQILDGLVKVNKDEQAADSAALTADMDATELPLHPSPPSLMSGELLVDLLPHQLQALKWMVDHEELKLPGTVDDMAVQFWVRQKGSGRGSSDYWLNVATKTPQAETPAFGRGGIVADGMGLGKTLTTLALVLATRNQEVTKGSTKTTLIVCPLSVLSNWEKQITEHVVDGKLRFYVYHGANKGVTLATLAKHDVVLTTYQTIAAEAAAPAARGTDSGKNAKVSTATGPLMKLKWKRVVADEGHVMKNPKAKMTRAFGALQAERRWICTGTPIVNSPEDLGSLLTCIRLCPPLDQPEYFRTLVLRPLKSGSAEAARLLQGIVGQALLRRTKETRDKVGKPLVSLPPIEFYQVRVKLDEETRRIYDEVHSELRRRFEESVRSGEGAANVLAMLTRLRQLCLSADLVPQTFLADIRNPRAPGNSPVPVSSLNPEQREVLIEKLKLAIADQEECSVCFDVLHDPRITDCGHPFCLLCISEVIKRQAVCPMDRHPIAVASLLDIPPDEIDSFNEHAVTPLTRSAKITELVRYLKTFDSGDKTLVFSQFTSFLDRVAARQAVIARFQMPVAEANADNSPVVMLISLKSGAVGLNLTAASNVFLCDPWWQSAIEAQAVDRMGQRKTVRVFQLIAENTIEAKVLEIQKNKDALIADAFAKSGSAEAKAAKKQARFEDLKQILGVE